MEPPHGKRILALDAFRGFTIAAMILLDSPGSSNGCSVRGEREAILQYHTQMLVLGRFLLSFGRSNELFILE